MRFLLLLCLFFVIAFVASESNRSKPTYRSKEEVERGSSERPTAESELAKVVPVTGPASEEKVNTIQIETTIKNAEFYAGLSEEGKKAKDALLAESNKYLNKQEHNEMVDKLFKTFSEEVQKELQDFLRNTIHDNTLWCEEGKGHDYLNRSWTPISESDKENRIKNLSAEARKALEQLNVIGTKSFDDIDKQVAFLESLSGELQKELEVFGPLHVYVGKREDSLGGYGLAVNLKSLKAALKKNETAMIFVEKGLRDGKSLAELNELLSKPSEEQKLDNVEVGKPEIEIDEIAPVTMPAAEEKVTVAETETTRPASSYLDYVPGLSEEAEKAKKELVLIYHKYSQKDNSVHNAKINEHYNTLSAGIQKELRDFLYRVLLLQDCEEEITNMKPLPEKVEKAAIAIEKGLRSGRGLIQVQSIGKVDVVVHKN